MRGLIGRYGAGSIPAPRTQPPGYSTGRLLSVVHYRSDASALGNVRKTRQGGIIVPANLTRTGVFVYDYADGTRVRELRHPDEVFKAGSLETLASAPITVLHPGEVTPANYRQVNVGHVDGTPKQSGTFVAADLRVQDADTIAKVDSKELTEISCGYRCNVVLDSGTYNGELYDARQTDMVYNHVAIGPKDWGRAGSEVKIRLDGPSWLAPVECNPAITPITKLYSPLLTGVTDSSQGNTMRFDDKGKLVADSDVEKAFAASVQAKIDGLDGQVAQLTAQVASVSADAKAKLDAANSSLVKFQDAVKADALKALVAVCLPVLGADFKADGKSAHDVRSAVVAKLSPDLKLDGKSEAFVEAAYELAIAGAAKATQALGNIQVVAGAAKLVQDGKDAVHDAELDAQYRSQNAWRGDSWLDKNPRK